MKKLLTILNCCIGAAFGVFISRTITLYRESAAPPEMYAVISSAPWYCAALEPFLHFLAVAAVCLLLRVLLLKRTARR